MKVSADIYDAVELVALAYGGIGSSQFFTVPSFVPDYNNYGQGMENPDLRTIGEPVCGIGMLAFAKDLIGVSSHEDPDIAELSRAIGFYGIRSDDAVLQWRAREGTQGRMPFDLWATAVGLERGE